MDLIIIFLAKNGKLFLDHTDPLKRKSYLLTVGFSIFLNGVFTNR